MDSDERALSLATKKLSVYNNIKLYRSLAQSTPLPNDSVDTTVLSLFFYHLKTHDKFIVLKEIRRIGKDHQKLIIADWGRPASFPQRVLFLLVQLLDGFETTRDSVEGNLPSLLTAAGFDKVRETDNIKTLLGTIRLYTAFAT